MRSFPTQEQLTSSAHPASDSDRLWQDLVAGGTPIADPNSDRMTFLWRAPAGFPQPVGVHLSINRITDKDHYSHGLMALIPGTDMWVRTLEFPSTLRASYCFTPLYHDDDVVQWPPSHDHYSGFLDVHNQLVPVVDARPWGLSVIRGREAPAQPEWEDPSELPSAHVISSELGFLQSRAHNTDVAAYRRCSLFLPEGAGTALPLLTVYDSQSWFDRYRLPHVFQRAIDRGQLPPVAVLGVPSSDIKDRRACLGANEIFIREVVNVAEKWAVTAAKRAGYSLTGPRILAGQSLGGLAGLTAALTIPHHYDHIISQSPSLWWAPDSDNSPAHLSQQHINWIVSEFKQHPIPEHCPVLHLSVGMRENLSVARTHILATTVEQLGWDVRLTVGDGGHDPAFWRGVLTTSVAEILQADSR